MSLVDESYVGEILSRLNEIPLLDKSTLYHYTLYLESSDPFTRFYATFLSSQHFNSVSEIAQWMGDNRVYIQCCGAATSFGANEHNVVAVELHPTFPTSGSTISSFTIEYIVQGSSSNSDNGTHGYASVKLDDWGFTSTEPISIV